MHGHTPSPFGEYQALLLGDASVTHCPPRETLATAMVDADEHPDADAQVMRLQPARRVVASREVGGAWHRN